MLTNEKIKLNKKYEIYIELNKKLPVKELIDSDDIKFNIVKEDNKTFLKGFSLIYDYKPTKNQFKLKALKLCNLLSIKNRIYTKYNFLQIQRIEDGQKKIEAILLPFTEIPDKPLNLDFSSSSLQISIADQNKDIIYHHAAQSLRSYYERDYVSSIRESFAIIESLGLDGKYEKYRHLRNGLSHGGILEQRTINKIKYFFELIFSFLLMMVNLTIILQIIFLI